MQSPCKREAHTSADEHRDCHLGCDPVTFGVICKADGAYNGSVPVQVLLLVIFKKPGCKYSVPASCPS